MIVPRLIERKRDGGTIQPDEWRELVLAYAAGSVPDYQISALLMAIFFQGMDRSETSALTDSMIASGAVLDLSHLRVPRIDKHSTGGVGDKVSLILAPLIASLGVAVPMMSGRGLGHTGGTLDKLEAIPGFRTGLTLDEARRQIERIGCAMIGQTGEIAPADRKMYALRDATGTVEAIPLIAASIMSKKLSEGLTGLVLDIKSGSGAFLPQLDREIELARTMIELGADRGCPVVALVTAMDRPLGDSCGNALEVAEAIAVLRGDGPDDVTAVTLALGAEMLLLAGAASTAEEAGAMQRAAIGSGSALEKLREIISAQSGDARVVDDASLLPHARIMGDHVAPRSGVVASVEPRAVGHGIVALGGGRTSMEDDVDPGAGFVITARPGDTVSAGDVLATVHASSEERLAFGRQALAQAITIGDAAPELLPLVSHRVTSAGVERCG